MKFKKILAVWVVGAVTAAYSPIALDGAFSVAYAATAGTSAQKISRSVQKSNAAEKKAPAVNFKASANKTANTQQSGSKRNSTIRNIDLFAGGMMLGSMISDAFAEQRYRDINRRIYVNVKEVGSYLSGGAVTVEESYAVSGDTEVYSEEVYSEEVYDADVYVEDW